LLLTNTPRAALYLFAPAASLFVCSVSARLIVEGHSTAPDPQKSLAAPLAEVVRKLCGDLMEPYLSPFGEALKATIALLLPLRLRRGSRIENDGEAGIWFEPLDCRE
jgi:hypothetical protein